MKPIKQTTDWLSKNFLLIGVAAYIGFLIYEKSVKKGIITVETFTASITALTFALIALIVYIQKGDIERETKNKIQNQKKKQRELEEKIRLHEEPVEIEAHAESTGEVTLKITEDWRELFLEHKKHIEDSKDAGIKELGFPYH